jgi:putative spermidine/putrescine transport system permease protein
LRRFLAIVVVAARAFPFAVLVLLSVAERWRFPAAWPPGWQPERWGEALGDPVAGSLGVSLVVSFAVALIATAAGFVTGKYVAAHRRSRALLFLAYLPFALSPVILGVCLLFLYLKLGLVGTIPGVVAAQCIFAFGFAIVFFSAFWTPEVRAYEDLVRTLGGSTWQVYRRALVPVARGAILLCFVQTFLLSWFQYGLTLLVGAGAVQTLPIQVFAYVNEANPYVAAVAALVLAAPPLALVWLGQRRFFAKEGAATVRL